MAAHYGPTGWWPGDTPFEVAVGAILTQNTAWTNVEKAIAHLKAARLLSPRALLAADLAAVEAALRPSGYFRQKTERVLLFCQWLTDRFGGSMRRMAAEPLAPLRAELLALRGIGPETADDILLYACEKPVFVVDAYTRRILGRHGIAPHNLPYEEMRALFEGALPADVALFKEYHGLIVWTGKDFCRTQPRCAGCPLAPLLPRGGPRD
ncbi:MAG: endonuclease III domain-containing protein [Candidatus Hydrogenedentes bacterium]|nr:endonuclease III domain-containing protein [Candidatus Hydrogenedentota bacterium]